MELTFVRHTSVDVPQGICYGHTDVPLSSTFPSEAQAVKQALESLPGFSRAYVSPLSRAKKLAAYCGYEKAQEDSRIIEINFGSWEMRSFRDIPELQKPDWEDVFLNIKGCGGETFQDEMTRVRAFIDQLRQEGVDRAICFTHGGVLLCAEILAGRFKPGPDLYTRFRPYGSVITLKF